MKRLLILFAILLCSVALLASCLSDTPTGGSNPSADAGTGGGTPDGGSPDGGNGTPDGGTEKVRVMIIAVDGIEIIGDNPREVPVGADVSFEVRILSGYTFDGVDVGEYDSASSTLTIRGVTERTAVRFSTTYVGIDTEEVCDYIFVGASPADTTSVYSQSELTMGTEITVTAGDESLKFIGWSFGRSYLAGGDIISTDRTFTFRATPELLFGESIRIFSNYTEDNIYYYEAQGGIIDTSSYNMTSNDYYTAEIDGNRVKVTLLDKYFSYAESASTFYDDGTFTKDGSVLVEYNTKPDGTGTSYSLGSKFYSGGKDGAVLYCIYKAASSRLDFDYSDITMPKPEEATYADRWAESGIIINGYLGDAAEVVIPETLDGKPVIAIGAGAFTDRVTSTVVIPKTVQRIEDGAFVRCTSLTTLYFPSGIYEISDAAFDAATYEGFTTLIVNATIAPRNTKTTDGGFAVKLSRLLAAEGKKKIILISGSSSYQGAATEYMEALLGGEYTFINFGTTRPRPGLFYLEALSHYTAEGDVFIFAPENSAFMMGENLINWRFINDLEGMNNLFRYVDISNWRGYFSAFAELNQTTNYKKPPLRYEDICINGWNYGGSWVSTDKNGDYQHPNRGYYQGKANYVDTYYVTMNERIKSIEDGTWNNVKFQEEHKDYTNLDDYTWTSFDREELVDMMNLIIGRAKESGAEVYFGFAPVDAAELVTEARDAEWLAAYDELIVRLYPTLDGILGSCVDYIYNTVYAYDCAFHVNDYGRTYRTYQLYRDLCEVLGITDINGIYDVGVDFDGCLFEEDSDGTPNQKVDFLE